MIFVKGWAMRTI